MLESWIIYAVLASIASGLFSFMAKIQAEKTKIHDLGFIFYTYVYMVIFSMIMIAFT